MTFIVELADFIPTTVVPEDQESPEDKYIAASIIFVVR